MDRERTTQDDAARDMSARLGVPGSWHVRSESLTGSLAAGEGVQNVPGEIVSGLAEVIERTREANEDLTNILRMTFGEDAFAPDGHPIPDFGGTLGDARRMVEVLRELSARLLINAKHLTTLTGAS